MCDSQADGGTRCAAHTRVPYAKVIEELLAKSLPQRGDVRRARFNADETNMMVVSWHASTPKGAKEIAALIAELKEQGDDRSVQWLRSCLKSGAGKAAVAKDLKAAVQKVKAQAKRAATKSMTTLKADPNLPFEDSHEAKYPEIAAMWDPDENRGILPSQVRPKANGEVHLICENNHKFSGRLNNYANGWDNGHKPSCPLCKPRRQAGFEKVQDRLRGWAATFGDNPEAFDQLSAATKLQLLNQQGYLSGAQDSFERSTALALAHGELTLREVLEANKVEKILSRIDERIDSDEEVLTTLGDEVLTPTGAYDSPTTVSQGDRIDNIMDSAGIADLTPDDEVLAGLIMHENLEALWNEAYNDPNNLDVILARVSKNSESNPFRSKLASLFEDELTRVATMPLPEGYQVTRVAPDGTIVEKDPLLHQRRFALLVEENRRFMNWSGTGAGKTLSSVLASRHVGAQETIVIAPLSVTGQWRDEFANSFPDTDIRMGLPKPGEDLDETHTGRPRVWIINYDKLQRDPQVVEEQLAPLADRLDAAILDEVHKVKQADPSTRSNRRGVLMGFLDRAGENNPDLAVMGSSATPVVTNLEEAKSLIRLVTGEDPRGFGTAPTVKNAANAYQYLSAIGMRCRPNYAQVLTKSETVVDITDKLDAVQARVDHMSTQHPDAKGHPATMERALLPEKLPAIVAAVRKADGPSLIYSEYTTGMVDPIVERMRAEGYRTERFTGDEEQPARAEILRRFEAGEIDVLVGSKPIATGVDGLQKRCRNLIVASMPWTAADDDQLVGRVFRQGQTENVEVTYILTEAKVGNTVWSWCRDHRLNRVHFRRSLSDAVVDGVMPDGTPGSTQTSAVESMEALKALNAALTKQRA